MNMIEMVLAKIGLAYSGVASSQSELEVCRAEAESPAAAGQKYWTWILVGQVRVSTFVCCCLKRWNKTHQAVFASEENVHGTDDPISKDQSQPETNEGDILKWIRRNYQIRSFCFYTLAKKSWKRVKFAFHILLLKLRKRWALSKRHLKSYRDENGEDVAVKKWLSTCSYTYYPSAFFFIWSSAPHSKWQSTYNSEKVMYD